MTNPPETTLPSPLNCAIGSAIAGVMSFALYTMTSNIATTFATRPMGHKTTMAVNIATAVRTLVVGSTALGAAVFGIIAVGLVALGIQVAVSGNRSGQKIG
jgi:Protein of unknown function (DUF3082)